MVPGTAPVGVAFPAGEPVAAIGVAAVSGRLDATRRTEVAEELIRQASKLEMALRATPSPGPAPVR